MEEEGVRNEEKRSVHINTPQYLYAVIQMLLEEPALDFHLHGLRFRITTPNPADRDEAARLVYKKTEREV